MPPSAWTGRSKGRITSSSRTTAFSRFRPSVSPVAVITSRSTSARSARRAITPCTPPARSRSSRWWGPAGLMLHRWGTRSLISWNSVWGMGSPTSWAMAGTCSVVLVEQPRAMSTAMAFKKAARVAMSRGRIPRANSSITFSPASLPRRTRAALTAGTVPLPGRARPSASARQFIELAVNMPAQEPQPGQQTVSSSAIWASLIVPAATWPTASQTVVRSVSWPCQPPASIGPPLRITAGMFNRSAAIIIPGVILSQLVTRTRASKGWAMAITSTESAISSRLAST